MLLYYQNKCWNTAATPLGSQLSQEALGVSLFPAAICSVFLISWRMSCQTYQSKSFTSLVILRPPTDISQTSIPYIYSDMNEFYHLGALRRPCCCKWLFCIEFAEYPGRVERLLYTNRPSGCYFSGDARLTRHRGRDIDRLSLSMQSSSLKETLERQRRQLGEERAAHIKLEQEWWGGLRSVVENTDLHKMEFRLM